MEDFSGVAGGDQAGNIKFAGDDGSVRSDAAFVGDDGSGFFDGGEVIWASHDSYKNVTFFDFVNFGSAFYYFSRAFDPAGASDEAFEVFGVFWFGGKDGFLEGFDFFRNESDLSF